MKSDVCYVSLLATVLLASSTLLVSGEAAAVSDHDIHVEDGDVHVEVTFELYAEDPDTRYNRWTTTVSAPESAEILRLEDSNGEIMDYSFEDGGLSFETNSGSPRNKEVVTLEYVDDEAEVESVAGFTIVDVQLLGFSNHRDDVADEVTQARVSADRDVLSWSPSHGFTSAIDEDILVLSGEGSAALRVVVGSDEDGHDHYSVSGGHHLPEADRLYSTVAAALGFTSPVETHPVAVLPDSRYDETVNPWSAGQHRTGGLILLRESVVEDGDPSTTVLHETTHAYNAFAFTWSPERPEWFDEGTAQYVEFLVDRQRGEVRSELFGGERREEALCPDGTEGCIRTIPPRGDADELWRYHQDGDSYMETWTTEHHRQRGFGYAFSELAIREYVMNEGGDALHSIYREMMRESRVEDRAEASDTVLDLMNYDLGPCDHASRQAFEDCVDQVNSMDAVIPEYQGGSRQTIEMQEIEMPEPREEQPRELHPWLQAVADLFAGLFDFLRGLFEGSSGTERAGTQLR